MIQNHSPLHERLKQAVEHPVPVPPPQPEHERARTSVDDHKRDQHMDDMADYAVDALAFRVGVREHLERQDRVLVAILDVLESLLADFAEDDEGEEKPQITLDGEPVPAERDQSQTL